MFPADSAAGQAWKEVSHTEAYNSHPGALHHNGPLFLPSPTGSDTEFQHRRSDKPLFPTSDNGLGMELQYRHSSSHHRVQNTEGRGAERDPSTSVHGRCPNNLTLWRWERFLQRQMQLALNPMEASIDGDLMAVLKDMILNSDLLGLSGWIAEEVEVPLSHNGKVQWRKKNKGQILRILAKVYGGVAQMRVTQLLDIWALRFCGVTLRERRASSGLRNRPHPYFI
ncbi:hypothetical protein B0H14DRAFT_2571933 [Mycena olivaceomarginata]|nr:hypothetical protein B0H14DRAFT_2601914 [Mycena olivaceomarginata]KAJ7869333.1 hypothetical protein B0H14DRAFT_2571933 [Mycena olivaceomarginata]